MQERASLPIGGAPSTSGKSHERPLLVWPGASATGPPSDGIQKNPSVSRPSWAAFESARYRPMKTCGRRHSHFHTEQEERGLPYGAKEMGIKTKHGAAASLRTRRRALAALRRTGSVASVGRQPASGFTFASLYSRAVSICSRSWSLA